MPAQASATSLKIGRRGSQSGNLRVLGAQGHVAYPHRAATTRSGYFAAIVALSDGP